MYALFVVNITSTGENTLLTATTQFSIRPAFKYCLAYADSTPYADSYVTLKPFTYTMIFFILVFYVLK